MTRWCTPWLAITAALSWVGCGTDEPVRGIGEAGASGVGTGGTPVDDADADGVTNSEDNCPATKNTAQEDANQNGTGDVCEGGPRFIVEHYDPEKCADGVTLVPTGHYFTAVRSAPDPGTNQLTPLYVFGDPSRGDFSDADILSDGRVLTLRGPDTGSSLMTFDPTGVRPESVYDAAMANHATQELPDGNLLFIHSEHIEHDEYGSDIDDDAVLELRVDGLRVIDADQQTVWNWSLWDNDPDAAGTKTHMLFSDWWSNCNSISFVAAEGWSEGAPLEGDVYMNCRLLNRLYKINYPAGTIEWVMGDDGDFGEGLFYRIHDAHVTFDEDNGHRSTYHILLYDNREGPPWGSAPNCPPDETCSGTLEPYSRVLQIDLDGTDARIVWKWPRVNAPDFDQVRFYSPLGGGVQRLPNGNLLLTNATEGGNPLVGQQCRSRVIEIAPNDSPSGAEIVWDLRFSGSYGTYKALRVPEATVEGWQSLVR